jgi:hypothetical protein
MSRPVSQTKTSIFTLVSKDGLDLVLCGLLPTGRPDRLSANWRPCEREVEGSNLGKTRPKKTGISDKDSLGEDVRRCTDPDRLRGLQPGRPQLSRGECDDTCTLQMSRLVFQTKTSILQFLDVLKAACGDRTGRCAQNAYFLKILAVAAHRRPPQHYKA